MTEISQLLARINNDPAYIGQMDWREETDWFCKERMKQIIIGIEEDEACNIAADMIVDNWYLACNTSENDPENPKRSLKDQVSWDGDFAWRFFPCQVTPPKDGSIDCFVSDVLKVRKDTAMRKIRLEGIKNKARQLKQEKPKVFYEEDEKVIEVDGEDVLMYHLENENKRLKQELEKKEKENKSLTDDLCSLAKTILEQPEDEEKKNIQERIKQARIEAVRELVEQLIIYAEKEDKNVAREIRIALHTKLANGFIANEILSDEWKQRLEDLGREKRKNDAMNFNNQVGTVVAHADHVTISAK